MSGHIEGVLPQPASIRDPAADRRKAIQDAIALHRSLGEEPPEHLLVLLAGYEGAEGGLEHTAAEIPPERVVPAGPVKPRKPSDADRAARRD